MLSNEDVKKIASLSMLNITDGELEAYAKDMDSIIAFANQIANAPIGESGGGDADAALPVYRDDIPRPSVPSDAITQNAANQDFGFISVLKRE